MASVKGGRILSLWLAAGALCLVTGCTNDMKDQPRFEAYERTSFFADGRSERPTIEGTVPRGGLQEDEVFYTGKSEGKFVESVPFEVTEKILKRGQERYNIYCIVCHDAAGTGNGMVIRRGFRPVPPSFHTDRLRKMPVGYFYDVMTHGYANMQDYAMQVEPADRWAIAAYMRALQLSQHAEVKDLADADKAQLAVSKS